MRSQSSIEKYFNYGQSPTNDIANFDPLGKQLISHGSVPAVNIVVEI